MLVRVLYDYDAQSNFELTIREGDIVVLTSTDCSEGWWEGKTMNETRKTMGAFTYFAHDCNIQKTKKRKENVSFRTLLMIIHESDDDDGDECLLPLFVP